MKVVLHFIANCMRALAGYLDRLSEAYLIAEWKAFLRYAWSVRFTALSIVCAAAIGCDKAWPDFAQSLPLTTGQLAACTVFFSVASTLSSIVIQRRIRGKK